MALYSKVAIDNAISKATKELGYNELRPNQLAAITSFVNGRDVFVCLPTGSGKSLCYCLLPTVFDKLKACTQSSYYGKSCREHDQLEKSYPQIYCRTSR